MFLKVHRIRCNHPLQQFQMLLLCCTVQKSSKNIFLNQTLSVQAINISNVYKRPYCIENAEQKFAIGNRNPLKYARIQ